MPSNPAHPKEDYTARLQSANRKNGRLAFLEKLAGNSKILWFLALLAGCYFSLGKNAFTPWWLLAFLLPALPLFLLHEWVTRAWQKSARRAAFFQRAIDRLNFTWQGKGSHAHQFQDAAHPYAADLDLFGKGSLFELLSIAHTTHGEKTLAHWLTHPTAKGVILERQEAVQELKPDWQMRVDMAVQACREQGPADFNNLGNWAKQSGVPLPKWLPGFAVATGVYGLFSIHAWLVLDWGLAPMALSLFLNTTAWLFLGRRFKLVFQGMELHAGSVGMLTRMLQFLESAHFNSPLLKRLKESVRNGQDQPPPSESTAQLAVWHHLYTSSKNQLFAPFAFLMNWNLVVGCGLEKWQGRFGAQMAAWLDTVGQLEAVSSLANYAFENPGLPFPLLNDEKLVYDGLQLRHPLMAPGTCVANDLCLDAACRLMILSGSNMSGKSTFLRTVGINAVLAMTGGPVCASRLEVSPMALGAVLRIHDSLAEGKSRFFAEIQRVRQVVDLSSGKLPVLFLLDEIFSGTNSHDRKLGATGVLAGLLKNGAMGLVTTHDLSLSEIVDNGGLPGANSHFSDRFEKGNLNFDYLMKPGVVRNSNALELMRSVGLDVGQPEEGK